jgi:moderate conductance mechanosensitive channel
VSSGWYDDTERWVRGTGLEILLIALGAILLARAIHWLASRSARRTEAQMQRLADAGVTPSTGTRHSGALVQVVEWLAIGSVYAIAILLMVTRAGVPLASLLPTAAVLGVALGFGAQRMVQDLLAGFFIISERQFGLGDTIRVGAVGSTTGVAGAVEAVTLRTTTMRTVEGEVVVIPNGEIRQVTNLSREWSRAVIDVKLPINEDLERVIGALRTAAGSMADDPAWARLLLDTPAVLGVESLDLAFAQVRIAARTQPGQQFTVARELRRRIAAAMRELDIVVPSTILAQ